MRLKLGVALWFLANTICAAQEAPILAILEDNAAELLPKLTNPTGDPGEGHVDEKVTFSGKSSIRIVPMQRFNNFIPGWDYVIREKPKPGEYRYLRFAWKAPGLSGVMLQLHDTDWHIRYTAGGDKYGWGTKYIAEKPPAEWKLVTVDLWKDFGDRNLHGIALTCFDGEAAWFDHIYFGRSVEDLDRIDATGLARDKPLPLTADELEQHWRDLDHTDDAKAYQAYWSLVAAGEPAQRFVRSKVGGPDKPPDAAQLRAWLKQLDDDEFDVREAATRGLKAHVAAVRALVQAALEAKPDAEVRFRLELILKEPDQPVTAEQIRFAKARRVLERIAERAQR